MWVPRNLKVLTVSTSSPFIRRGWVGWRAVICVQGVQQGAQNVALRGTSAECDCGGVGGAESHSLWAARQKAFKPVAGGEGDL